MKLESLIYNKDKDIINYIYQDSSGNFYGYGICDNGYTKIDQNIFYEIYNAFRFKDNCKYLENFNSYDVYYDEENNLKHFRKNGKEDLELFLKFNTSDYIMYSRNNKNFNHSNSVKLLLLKGSAIILSATMLITLVKLALNDVNPITAIKYSSSMLVYDIADTFNFDMKCLTKEDAIDLIYSSENLPYDLKKKFINQDLFDDVFPYYKNTKMEYIIRKKLTDLSTEDYGMLNPNFYNSSAYYDELEPNVIHLNKITKTYNKSSGHEFVHLLQFPFLTLKYIREATASIINYEYFNENDRKYQEAVENIRLLMDVVGPKAIWEYIFSGDDTSLNNILNENLDKKDYKKLLKYLSKKPTDNNHEKIKEIIERLYFNIHNKDIKKDYSIFDTNGDFINNRIYFNNRIMKDCLYHNCSIETALTQGLISEETYYRKKISEDEIIKYSEDTNVILAKELIPQNCKLLSSSSTGKVKLKLKSNDKIIEITQEDALKRRYLKYENIIYVKENDLEKYNHLETIDMPSFTKFVCNYDDVSISKFAPTGEQEVLIRVNNISEKFPNDIINKTENNQVLVRM